MKACALILIALLPLCACKPKPVYTPPLPPAPKPQGVLSNGDYYCYTAGGVVLGNQAFRIREPGKYAATDGHARGTYIITEDNVFFTGGHFDKSTGRNLKNDTFRIGTGIECAPKPTLTAP